MKKIEEQIIKPTINGIKYEKIDYCGFVFFGLINVKGNPYVIEYNCRMGDPETEVVIPRIKNDIVELFLAAANKQLNQQRIMIDEQYATTVVLVSGGYPDEFDKNMIIKNLEETKDCLVFHAGTTMNNEQVVTNGGRVLAITAYGNSKTEALNICYENATVINYDKMFYRRDIGFDLE
jgi:phosphoribosylamine---glycine ligase